MGHACAHADIVRCSRLDSESEECMHVQAAHTQVPCVDPKQRVAHPAHTAFSTWPTGSLLEGQKSNWVDIMPGEHTLMSPQGTPKRLIMLFKEGSGLSSAKHQAHTKPGHDTLNSSKTRALGPNMHVVSSLA